MYQLQIMSNVLSRVAARGHLAQSTIRRLQNVSGRWIVIQREQKVR